MDTELFYTLTFIFNPALTHVWLIEKDHPEWQTGLLNGIGGKIEEGENPRSSAKREIKEEAGVNICSKCLLDIGEIVGHNNSGIHYQVYVYAMASTLTLTSCESEKVKLVKVENLNPQECVKGLLGVIKMCILHLKEGI